jgi:hypothetical protein
MTTLFTIDYWLSILHSEIRKKDDTTVHTRLRGNNKSKHKYQKNPSRLLQKPSSSGVKPD